MSLGIGRYPISPIRVVQTLLGGGNAQEKAVVLKIRLPRIIAATLIGAGLALAGQTMQMIFRNPLVSPDVLGTSTAAGFGASVSLLLGMSTLAVTMNAFVFGIASVVLVWAIGARIKGEHWNGRIIPFLCWHKLHKAHSRPKQHSSRYNLFSHGFLGWMQLPGSTSHCNTNGHLLCNVAIGLLETEHPIPI